LRRKLRVLVLIDRPITTGGGERVASVLAGMLDADRYVRVLCSTRSSPAQTFEEELTERGVRILVLKRTSKLALWAWGPFLRFLRRERIDVLHAHKFGSNLWGTILGRLSRVPVVIAHEHSWSYSGQPLRRFLDREVIARGADAVVAVSREDERRMVEVEGIEPSTIRFIPNGIPTPERKGHDLRAELRLSESTPVVASVGQLRPEKALEVLIAAAKRLTPEFAELRVLIVGHGPAGDELQRLVAEAALEDTVLFLGRRNDVPDVLDAIDVAVCCSDREGSPLSVMEYMAAGKPVVATSVGGVPDLIDDGVHGLLVPPRRPDELADAVALLLSNRDRRLQMGERARIRQQEEFSFAAFVRRVEDLYDELFAQTSRAKGEGWTPFPRVSRD
jgi:glycosyltransferase involved in cell wall biosynthesis